MAPSAEEHMPQVKKPVRAANIHGNGVKRPHYPSIHIDVIDDWNSKMLHQDTTRNGVNGSKWDLHRNIQTLPDDEHAFWVRTKRDLIGVTANIGIDEAVLRRRLYRLRIILSVLYVAANTTLVAATCYMTGLTSYFLPVSVPLAVLCVTGMTVHRFKVTTKNKPWCHI